MFCGRLPGVNLKNLFIFVRNVVAKISWRVCDRQIFFDESKICGQEQDIETALWHHKIGSFLKGKKFKTINKKVLLLGKILILPLNRLACLYSDVIISLVQYLPMLLGPTI
jgi:hypothetical protein